MRRKIEWDIEPPTGSWALPAEMPVEGFISWLSAADEGKETAAPQDVSTDIIIAWIPLVSKGLSCTLIQAIQVDLDIQVDLRIPGFGPENQVMLRLAILSHGL